MKKLIPLNIITILLTFLLMKFTLDKLIKLTEIKMTIEEMNEARFIFFCFIILIFCLFILFFILYYLIYNMFEEK
jgi:hypothetical protein